MTPLHRNFPGLLLLASLVAVGGVWRLSWAARTVAAGSDRARAMDSRLAAASQPPPPSPTPGKGPQWSRQVVLVLTPGWDSPRGRLQRWERASLKGPWTRVGEDVPVVVGRNGLGWGRGLPDAPRGSGTGPRKREGDGRAPAGCFGIPEAFGFAPRSEASRFVRLPYRQLTPDTECIDDPLSRHYNRILLTRPRQQRDWSSSEKMREVSLYRWGAWVGHNDSPPRGGAGSCIFLHIWKDAETGTAGCTAMAEADMKALLGWLVPEAQPVLVQLPRQEYDTLPPGGWGLPNASD